MSATRRMLVPIFFSWLLVVAAPTASADPYAPGPVIPIPVPSGGGNPVCNAPGLLPCAPPAPFTLTPAQGCAVIAWRMHIPCNWWPGVQVPTGTPGSVG